MNSPDLFATSEEELNASGDLFADLDADEHSSTSTSEEPAEVKAEKSDSEYEETPMLSARNGPPSLKLKEAVKKSQRTPKKARKRGKNQPSIGDHFKRAKEEGENQELPTSSSSIKSNGFVTPERKIQQKMGPLEDSPLSPRWEKARKALCSPSLRREQEEAARAIFEKANSTSHLNGSARDKATRAKMHGFECPCCEGYYDSLGLTAEERRQRVNQVSRHRGFQQMPRTPERYWDVHFPSMEEQKALGLDVVCDEPLDHYTKPKRRLL